MSTSTSPTRAPKSPVAADQRVASPTPAPKSPVKETSAAAAAPAGDDHHEGETTAAAAANGNGERRNNNRRGPRAPRERDPAEEARKVFVGNLAYSATEEGIKAHFQAAGEIERITIAQGYNKPKGFGFVTFKDESSVAKAVADYHKSELNERTINVEAAAAREPRERKPRPQRERKPRAEGEDAQEGEHVAEGGERRERRQRKPHNKSAGGAADGEAAAAEGEEASGENGESKRAPRRRNDRRARRSSQDAEGQERPPREPRKPLSETGTPLPTTIYVRNLAHGTTADEITEWVKANGFDVVKTSLFHKSGSSKFHRPPRDFAFVELESTEAQTKAVEELNGKELKERAMVVQVAYEKVERKRRERKPSAAEGGDEETKAVEAAADETEAQAVGAKEQEE